MVVNIVNIVAKNGSFVNRYKIMLNKGWNKQYILYLTGVDKAVML